MSSELDSTISSDRAPRSVEEYLARLAERLAPLPESDRRDILEETRGHLADRYAGLDPGAAAAAATRELGAPEEYASAFLENYGVGPGAGQRGGRSAGRIGAVLLAALAGALFLFGLVQILTPPWAEPVWFIWRDVGFGDYGWLLFALGSWALAAAAAVAARALARSAKRPPG